MKHLLFGAIASACLCAPVLAQPQNNAGANNAFGRNGNAVFQLPESVRNVVSIDALNTIIIAQDGEDDGATQYTPLKIQHVYSGGIARLFGGTAVPTAQFATPGLLNGGNNNQNNGGFGGQNQNGASNFGGNNFGSNSNNGGFGGNNFGGGFGNNGFGNTILQGNGFNTQNRNFTANARVRAR